MPTPRSSRPVRAHTIRAPSPERRIACPRSSSGSFVARAGKEAEAAAAFEALVEPTHNEEGCILYALHRGRDDPRKLAFIERWESKDHLDAHLERDHVKQALARFDELFESGDITAYDALPAGEHRNGSLAAHAAV
jgi:quinol monooxygenase YgiN